MKIILIGYGKMGHTLERMAVARGHSVIMRIDPYAAEAYGEEGFSRPEWQEADIAIEFTTPSSALTNVLTVLNKHIPVVCGTTGWDIAPAQQLSQQTQTAFLWSSNFSLGVNLFFALNQYLTRLIQDKGYQPSIEETHHIHKLDRPSGTAKTLAQQIGNDIPITSYREGEVAGIHTVTWDSPEDTITITHSAKSRDGFALGAIIAAEWLADKQGPHTMNEVLNL